MNLKLDYDFPFVCHRCNLSTLSFMYHTNRELKVVVREDGSVEKCEEQSCVLAKLNQQKNSLIFKECWH